MRVCKVSHTDLAEASASNTVLEQR